MSLEDKCEYMLRVGIVNPYVKCRSPVYCEHEINNGCGNKYCSLKPDEKDLEGKVNDRELRR